MPMTRAPRATAYCTATDPIPPEAAEMTTVSPSPTPIWRKAPPTVRAATPIAAACSKSMEAGLGAMSPMFTQISVARDPRLVPRPGALTIFEAFTSGTLGTDKPPPPRAREPCHEQIDTGLSVHCGCNVPWSAASCALTILNTQKRPRGLPRLF